MIPSIGRGDAKAPWILSTQRLQQNIQRVSEWTSTPAGMASFRYEYKHWTRILQTQPSREFVRRKLPRQEVIAQIYHLREHRYIDWSFLHEEAAPPGHPPDHPPDHNFEPACASRSVESCLKEEFLETLFVNGHYYSVPQPGVADEPVIFQILKIGRQPLQAVRTFGAKPNKSGYLRLNVKYFDCWRREVDEGGAVKSITGVADSVELPSEIAALSVSSWTLLFNDLYVWKAVVSDFYGCVDLTEPRKVTAMAKSADDPTAPVLTFIMALIARGWRKFDGTVRHTRENIDRKLFSLKDAHNRQKYFRCLLILPTLFHRGLTALPSTEVQPFYQALLEGLLVQPGKGAKYYNDCLEGKVVLPIPVAAAPLPAPATPGDDDDTDILQAAPPPPPAPLAAPDPPIAAASSSSDTGSGSDSDSSGVLQAAAAPAVVAASFDDYPGAIDGARLLWEDQTGMAAGYRRLRICCTRHHGCDKRRNIGPKTCKNFGKFEPLAYLALWHQRGLSDPLCSTIADHRKIKNIPKEALRTWLQEHGYM